MSYDHWLLCIYWFLLLGLWRRWMRIDLWEIHWTHKSDSFNFSIGVPIHKKNSRDEITTVTGTGKIPKRKDTICGSPSLFSFIATKSKDGRNDVFDAVAGGFPSSKGPMKRKSLNSALERGRRQGGTTSPPLINTLQPRPQACRVSSQATVRAQATLRPQDTPRPSSHRSAARGSYGPPSGW